MLVVAGSGDEGVNATLDGTDLFSPPGVDVVRVPGVWMEVGSDDDCVPECGRVVAFDWQLQRVRIEEVFAEFELDPARHFVDDECALIIVVVEPCLSGAWDCRHCVGVFRVEGLSGPVGS